MADHYTALVIARLIFLGSLISVETGISVALIEITLGVIGENFLGISSTPRLTFLAGFGGILLTFFSRGRGGFGYSSREGKRESSDK